MLIGGLNNVMAAQTLAGTQTRVQVRLPKERCDTQKGPTDMLVPQRDLSPLSMLNMGTSNVGGGHMSPVAGFSLGNYLPSSGAGEA